MQYLFGKKTVIEAIKANNAKCVILTKNQNDIISLCKTHKIDWKIVDSSFFKNKFNHQYICCEVDDINVDSNLEDYLKKNHSKRILVLDSIEDPFNFGAILRNAAAFDFEVVIYKKHNQAQINDFVTKTSTGAITKLKLFRVSNLVNILNLLKKHRYWIYSSCLANNSQDITKVNFSGNIALIVGNEQKGISKLVLENSDFFIKIPISTKIQSLNVATASGILMFYIINQTR